MRARRITLRALRGEAARYEKPQTEPEAALIQAATRLFAERGYDATRTAQIAAMAGVTERTLFRYFPTKSALYRRVMLPAILAAALPGELTDLSRLFTSESENYADWHRRILKMRLEVAKRAGPQFRLLIATLMTDEALRRRVIEPCTSSLVTRLRPATSAICCSTARNSMFWKLRDSLSPVNAKRPVLRSALPGGGR